MGDGGLEREKDRWSERVLRLDRDCGGTGECGSPGNPKTPPRQFMHNPPEQRSCGPQPMPGNQLRRFLVRVMRAEDRSCDCLLVLSRHTIYNSKLQ
jgi:hypothetical protein